MYSRRTFEDSKGDVWAAGKLRLGADQKFEPCKESSTILPLRLAMLVSFVLYVVCVD